MLAGFYGDDRRRWLSGIRPGRDQQIADLQAFAELWSAEADPQSSRPRQPPGADASQFLAVNQDSRYSSLRCSGVVETNSDDKTVACS